MKPTQNDTARYHRKPRAVHCSKGHSYSEQNSLYAFDSDGYIRRRCKICRSEFFKLKYKRINPHWTEILIGGI